MNIKPKFDSNGWALVEDHFNKHSNTTWETLFSLGNGYIGMRGSFEEGLNSHSIEGTYINGFYDTFPHSYPEGFFGYADSDQSMLNIANARRIRLVFEDGEIFDPLVGNIVAYSRKLDLRTGILVREMTWQSPSGKRFRFKMERLISFERQHVTAMRLTLIPENYNGNLNLYSLIDCEPNQSNLQHYDPRNTGSAENIELLNVEHKITEGHVFLLQRTHHSHLTVACGVRDLFPEGAPTVICHEDMPQIGNQYMMQAIAGQPIVFEKYMVYATSLDTEPDSLSDVICDHLDNDYGACATGFEGLCTEQRTFLDDFWDRAAITIDGDDWLQGVIRFNMFHLLQSAGRNGKSGIPAKGLTGQGYRGHYFWDTEVYMLPFFLHTQPNIARKLLEYRFHILPHARHRAREMEHKQGALFAWRSINGVECSANPPTGTAQYHINAAIAFAIKRYYETTHDANFMRDYGAEILFETARIWYDVGEFIPTRQNQFCIHSVTGPDEYTTLVDNNTYTNLMARNNLWFAAAMFDWMQETFPDRLKQLSAKIVLKPDEPLDWKSAADAMYVPPPLNLGTDTEPNFVMPQDDTFLYRPVWNLAQTPSDHFPLLLHYHPLVYNRYQVCKQADLILAEYLLGDLPIFTQDQKRRDFDYYNQITTHDSSLSLCIFSIMAAELANKTDTNDAYLQLASDYYWASASIDLQNNRNETRHGIHAANMGGSWMGIVFGFAGMRVKSKMLSFAPVMPNGWNSYAFRVFYQGRRLEVAIGPQRDTVGQVHVSIDLIEGTSLTVQIYDQIVHIEP